MTPVLSASATSLQLSQATADTTAIAFEWVTGNNGAPGPAITYTLQLATKGSSFAAPVRVPLGQGSNSRTYTGNAFNNLLVDSLQLPLGVAQELEVRLKTQEGQKTPMYSNVLVVSATPYESKISLWIVGDATPRGWDIDNAAPLQQSALDATEYTFNEVLNAGEFKIATARDWGAPFYRPTTATPSLSSTEVQLSAGDPDYKWRITTAGAYKITLNTRTMTIKIVPFTPYANLWLVGDATPAGWDIDNPTPLTATANPYIFTYSGPLKAGEFKIPTKKGDWGGDFFMPLINGQPLTDTGMDFVPGGSPDKKWKVATAGNYTITLDQLHETILIK
ncbi:hypothetical protein GCM10027348_39160 [Hymenobacter tenuis]